ncbi:L-fucose/L-arabinose isomerase family protein [Diplocloster agilis]|uniref:L-fucose/L-arabinose isomerase family protein n=1 Tax=Diplocloster agilis TaxID=2850323 RepID=A0A949K1D4_9FIRM|nr:L-fucose/L-arabinose isomerase family protein [Diplocloster agilis]MBU9736930.1 L-fucose/L-arabinose isomerase family protein [Diplocloster agilis]
MGLYIRKPNAVIGIFCIGLNTYWAQFEGLKEAVLDHYGKIKELLSEDIRVIDGGLVDDYAAADKANRAFEEAGADLIFCYCATYSPSSNVLPVIRGLSAPVVVLNLQPESSVDCRQTDTIGAWLGTLSCAGAPEVTAVLKKKNASYGVVTGAIAEDPQVVSELHSWCKAASVAARFKRGRIGMIGHPFNGMMDLYVDETKIYNQFGIYTEFLELHQIKNAMSEVSDELLEECRQFIRDHFALSVSQSAREFEELCKVTAAMIQLIREQDLDAVAFHYAGETKGEYKDIIGPMNIVFSALIALGIPCCVEGDIKTTIAMLITKVLSGCCATAELYSMDLENDTCLIGHSGSSDFALSDEKPVLKESEVFHGKSGKGYLTQFMVKKGPVTLLALSEDGEGSYRLIAAKGESVAGDILMLGDTNTRVRFPIPVREFMNRWCMAGPSHHSSMAVGSWMDMIRKTAVVLGLELEIIC